jgi:hypothetical protein
MKEPNMIDTAIKELNRVEKVKDNNIVRLAK